jgi:hypothetical protein
MRHSIGGVEIYSANIRWRPESMSFRDRAKREHTEVYTMLGICCMIISIATAELCWQMWVYNMRSLLIHAKLRAKHGIPPLFRDVVKTIISTANIQPSLLNVHTHRFLGFGLLLGLGLLGTNPSPCACIFCIASSTSCRFLLTCLCRLSTSSSNS